MSKQFLYSIEIDAPSHKVWAALADFGGVYKYSPGVADSHSLTVQNSGLGAERLCQLNPSGQVKERIIRWEEGRSYALEIFSGKGTPPFKKAIATLSVEPRGAQTAVQIHFDYAIKYGPLGALMDALMFNRFLRGGLQGLLAGLKKHVETGEQISTAKGLQFAAVTA